MITTPNLGLKVWNLTTDPYNSGQLADNWARVDEHDHTSGKGKQIATGAIADNSITSNKLAIGVNVPPDNTVTPAKLTSSVGNFGAWTAFTTTWGSGGTAPAIGNGTIVSAYSQIGKTVNFRILLTAGSTTTFGTSYYTFTVPVTAASGATGSFTPIGNAVASDTSASLYYEATTILANTTQVFMRYQTSGLFGQTAPVTFANTDIIAINGTYEVT